jgi:hypothetical protein
MIIGYSDLRQNQIIKIICKLIRWMYCNYSIQKTKDVTGQTWNFIVITSDEDSNI